MISSKWHYLSLFQIASLKKMGMVTISNFLLSLVISLNDRQRSVKSLLWVRAGSCQFRASHRLSADCTRETSNETKIWPSFLQSLAAVRVLGPKMSPEKMGKKKTMNKSTWCMPVCSKPSSSFFLL